MRELLRAKARAAMQKRDSSIQDAILDKLQEERKPVTVVIINGFQIKGRISASDRHVVVMDTDGKQQIVYKHAISTIRPRLTVAREKSALRGSVTPGAAHQTKYTALTWIIVSMGSVPVVFGFFTLSFLAALFKALAGLAG